MADEAPGGRRDVARLRRLDHLSDEDRALLAQVGRQLRSLRLRGEPRRSIRQLAEQAGLDSAYLGEVERGRANLSVVAAGRLARVLSIPVASLFDPPPDATLTDD